MFYAEPRPRKQLNVLHCLFDTVSLLAGIPAGICQANVEACGRHFLRAVIFLHTHTQTLCFDHYQQYKPQILVRR